MTGFKGMLACGVALAALAIAQPASATIMVSVSDGSTPISGCTTNDSGSPGSVSTTCSDGNFSAITVNATGSPLLAQPGLTSNTVQVTDVAAGAHTLTIDVVQTGLSFTGDVNATLGVNLITGGASAMLEVDAPDGTSILQHTFTAMGTTGAVPITLGAISSDALIFTMSFTGAGEIGVSQNQILGVPATPTPEPASLALLGTALAGLTVFAVRRRRS